MELRLCNPFRHIIPLSSSYSNQVTSSSRPRCLSVRSSHVDPNESRKFVENHKDRNFYHSASIFGSSFEASKKGLMEKSLVQLVLEVKEKLEKDHQNLPVGENGRDDEDLILWFLKDRKFSVQESVEKLHKAIKWRQEFGVSELSQYSVKKIAETGKAYVHDFLDVNGRPVLIVDAAKHFPGVHDPVEDEKLCVFLIERALSALPEGREEILGIINLRGFGTANSDLRVSTSMADSAADDLEKPQKDLRKVLA
ncbi:hypothetical protein ACLB2K_049016 [Fragaria x ananassa]